LPKPASRARALVAANSAGGKERQSANVAKAGSNKEKTMTDAPLPTPAPGMIARAATAVADSASATAATVVSIFAIPAVGTCLTLVIGGLVTWGGMAVKAHYEQPKLVIQAADAPKPSPVLTREDVERILGSRADRIEAKIDALKVLLETKTPAPAVVPKRTRTSAK
jgi:hypothetical protein